MPVEMIDFDDLPDEQVEGRETITVSFKLDKEVQAMFKKIASRERRNITEMGGIVVEEFVNNYINKYKESKES